MRQRAARGADALVHSLVEAGVRRIFTVSGNHIMPVYDAAFDAGIELVHTRHEASAVHMADAWGRLTGDVGVALLTGGPGHANGVAALYTALMAESPMVLFSGHAPTNQLQKGAFQEMRQVEMAAPVAKSAWMSASVDEVSRDMQRAIALARGGRPGPVHVSLPVDALEAKCDVPPQFRRRERPRAAPKAVFDAAPFIERLRRAKRPLVITGPVGLTRHGRERMAALEAALRTPVVGMESPRGVADPSLGAFKQMLARADCILLLGKRLDFTLKFGAVPTIAADCAFLQIDADEAEIARSRVAVKRRLEQSLVAPLIDAADVLIHHAARDPRPPSGWVDEVRAAIAYRPDNWSQLASSSPDRLHPHQALAPLQAILDGHRESVFVSDGGEFGQWAQATLRAPHRVINGVAGAIGSALPFALAARLARPDAPVIATMGDGTFGFHPAEIDTAVRHKLAFVAVVGNDARWNAEYQIQLREYGAGRAIGTQLLPTHYGEVAKAFGGHGERVTDAREVTEAALRAIRSRLPAVLDVMIESVAAPEYPDYRPSGHGRAR